MRVRWRRGQGDDRGLTLVELAVAVLILSIGTLAVLRSTDQARLVIGGSEDRLLARLVAENRAAELQALLPADRTGLPSQVMMGGQRFVVETSEEITAAGLKRVEITARAPRGAGTQLVVYLP